MLIRGFAAQVKLPKPEKGMGVYEDLARRIDTLNGPGGAAGRLALGQSLGLAEAIQPKAFSIVPLNVDGSPHQGGDNSQVLFGLHSPYPKLHVVVTPDLKDHKGIDFSTPSAGPAQGSRLYRAKRGNTFEVTKGFVTDGRYEDIALGVAEKPLPGYCWRQGHDPNLSYTNVTVGTWLVALGLNSSR